MAINYYWDFILDPWNPTNKAYLSTDDGLYKSSNIGAAAPTWSLVLSQATIEAQFGAGFDKAFKVIASINVQDYVAYFFEANAGDACMAYSSDGGTTWSFSTIDADSENVTFAGAVDYVPHLIGGQVVMYIAGGEFTGSPPQYRPAVFKSTNSGATWTQTGSIGAYVGGWGITQTYTLHCPYTNNDNGNTLYVTVLGATWKSVDGGVTFTSLGIIPENNVSRHGVETWTLDDRLLYVWDVNSSLQVSTNAGVSFTQKGTVPGNTIKAGGGFPFENSTYYAVTVTGIYYSTDGGNNFFNKTGNFPATTSLSFTGTNNKAVIVPLWVS